MNEYLYFKRSGTHRKIAILYRIPSDDFSREVHNVPIEKWVSYDRRWHMVNCVHEKQHTIRHWGRITYVDAIKLMR